MKKDGSCGDETTKRQPLKVLWYLPIIPWFKLTYANVKEAKKLRWHFDERIYDRK